MVESFEGKFKKACIKELGIKEYGKYRGNGKVIIDDEGVKIEGRHVKSLGSRWGIGILLVFASGMLTGGAVFLGFIPIYLLVEYVFLKKENLVIPWGKIRKYAFVPKKKLVALDFDGPPNTSPAVIQMFSLTQIAIALRSKATDKDATANIEIT